MLKAKSLVPATPLASVPSPRQSHLTRSQTSDPLHSCSSLLALRTYRDSSSCRPNGCRAQGVSKSGSDFGPRQRSVATVASDQTWTNQRKEAQIQTTEEMNRNCQRAPPAACNLKPHLKGGESLRCGIPGPTQTAWVRTDILTDPQ